MQPNNPPLNPSPESNKTISKTISLRGRRRRAPKTLQIEHEEPLSINSRSRARQKENAPNAKNIHNSVSNRRKTRKMRKKKRISKNKIMKSFPEIERLRRCTSKANLRRILLSLDAEWKKIIKFYMTECFIYDLYVRRLENKMFLLSKRQLLYTLIDNPELLTTDCHFDNNLLKNYCTGIANFILNHYEDIKMVLERRRRE